MTACKNDRSNRSTAVRTLVAWCPDWPIVAAGVSLDVPAAVFVANRVVACSPAARREGVVRHQRRREAQARCPDLTILDHDPARDAREFEPVITALATLTPRVEVVCPGRGAFPTRGPSRYFGGDDALARRAAAAVAESLAARGEVSVGVADGPFAATLAARAAHTTRASGGVLVVPSGESGSFVAPLPLATLDRPELVDVLGRLGMRTLGDFAALPATDVLARFGGDGLLAHRLASGCDERPPATDPPPLDLTVSAELDPPAERVEAAAFVARGLADELHQRLSARGSSCTRLLIGAETEHGERLERLWRAEQAGAAGRLSAGAIADRVRWQLDGWLTGTTRAPNGDVPTAGITRLWLVPDDIVPSSGRLLGFWGSDTAAADRAVRAVSRVQGLLGPEAVVVPEWRGGRSPVEQVTTVPAALVDLADERPAARRSWVSAPWPGRVPDPAPSTVHPEPIAAEVLGSDGVAVAVSGRGDVSLPPAALRVGNGQPLAIAAWAGPWPVDERWWDAAVHRRRARFQVVTVDGVARLLAIEGGRWWVEATYD